MEILLTETIAYTTMNGTRMLYNCLSTSYDEDHKIKLILTSINGCAYHNELCLTTEDIDTPHGYFALRPNMRFTPVVTPVLEAIGLIVRHPENMYIHKSFVDYPLYSLNLPQYTGVKQQPSRESRRVRVGAY